LTEIRRMKLKTYTRYTIR